MFDIPVKEPCSVIMYPDDPFYIDDDIRLYQGCPTIVATKKGRLFAGWYSGGTREPHPDNFNLIVMSDDLGKTWSKPICVIPSDRKRFIHSLDIELWTDPDGRLWVFWVQNRTIPATDKETHNFRIDGIEFPDHQHSEFAMVCDDPDADKIVFSAPRRLDDGFLRCKPTVLSDGRWMNFNYDQLCDLYAYSISCDKGETWTRYYGSKKIDTPFDEAMAVQKRNGDIHMMARTYPESKALAETFSHDSGKTWDDTKLSCWRDPSSRFFYGRTPRGNLILIKNDDADTRKNMTVFLSEDDGVTWPYKALIDSRDNVSYPDADYFDGKIYIVHDCGRTGEREILFSVCTEDDIRSGKPISPASISKPKGAN